MPLRLGLLADPQYAPLKPWRTRFFSHSLWKVARAIETFNQEPLDLCVTLGDLIDCRLESYGHILPLFADLRHAHHFVLGNHDFLVEPHELALVPGLLGRSERRTSFSVEGWQILIVDGTEIATYSTAAGTTERDHAEARLAALVAARALQAKPWNATMSEEQLRWLEQELTTADLEGRRALVLGHYPVYPPNDHNLWDDRRFVELVTAHRSFVAYLCGHNHVGNYGSIDGRHFINLKGMVDTPDETAFAIVEIDDDRLVIRGFGREESRSLDI